MTSSSAQSTHRSTRRKTYLVLAVRDGEYGRKGSDARVLRRLANREVASREAITIQNRAPYSEVFAMGAREARRFYKVAA